MEETGEAIDARARVVARARGELGEQNPNKYYAVVAPAYFGHVHDKAWCGVFALWCYVSEGLCSWQWEDGDGFAFRLTPTDDPQPGDLAVFERSPSGAVLWHHAIVELVPDEFHVYTIDGNALPNPKEGVEARIHPRDANARFYSIEALISDPPTRPEATSEVRS